jgi:hypothetical protein
MRERRTIIATYVGPPCRSSVVPHECLAQPVREVAAPAAKPSLWLRFGCGHEQKIGPNDDIASFVENARFEPCDACALARAAS